MLVQKIHVKKIFRQKIFGSKKVRSKKVVVKKLLPKKIRYKNSLGPKKFWVKIILDTKFFDIADIEFAVGGGGGWWWWCEVIFMSNPTFELRLNWVIKS